MSYRTRILSSAANCFARMAVVLLVWGCTPMSLSAWKRDLDQSVDAAPRGKLSLDLEGGGNVRLRGWSQQSVRVRALFGGRSGLDTEVAVEAVAQGVHIRSWRKAVPLSPSVVFLDIFVPHQYDVLLDSAGGRLSISNVEGTFQGHIAGGMITIEHTRGKAELVTTGGAIHVTDSELEGSIMTGGGSIKLRNVTGGLQATYRRKMTP
jgi:hypothetical protein